MKNIKYLILVLVAALLLGSCDEDSFSQVKVIDLPEHESRLSVTAKLDVDLTIPFVFVSQSKELLDNTPYEVIDDASVKMYKNDELFIDFAWDETFDNYRATSTPIIEDGTYKLEIAATGYDPIVATQTLPKSAEIMEVKLEEDAFVTEWGDSQDILEVTIKDDSSERNYYNLSVVAKGTFPSGETLTLDTYGYSEDPLMEYGYQEDFLPDETFNGGTYVLRFIMSDYWKENFQVDQGGDIEKLIITVDSFSEEYYRYSTSRLTYEDSQEIPFIEPVLITTNWDKGFGVFGLTNKSKFDLEF